MDIRLRELERRFKETGDVQDEAALLQAKVRVDILTPDQIYLAAQLGHPAALLIYPNVTRVFESIYNTTYQDDILEEFLLKTITASPRPTPYLPFWITLAFLELLDPVFDPIAFFPVDILETMNQVNGTNLTVPYSEIVKNYRSDFESTVMLLRVEHGRIPTFGPIRRSRWPIFELWLELVEMHNYITLFNLAYTTTELPVAFTSAAAAYFVSITTLRNNDPITNFPSIGSIRYMISCIEAAKESLHRFVGGVLTAHSIAAAIRPKVIPELLEEQRMAS